MKRDKGFTLIELMVVMVVIAMLMGFVGSAIFRAIDSGKMQRVEAQKVALKSAIIQYKTEYGYWPAEDQFDESASDYTRLHIFDAGRTNPYPNSMIMDCLKASSTGVGSGTLNPRNISFINVGEYGFDDDGNVLNPTSRVPYLIKVDYVQGTVNIE